MVFQRNIMLPATFNLALEPPIAKVHSPLPLRNPGGTGKRHWARDL